MSKTRNHNEVFSRLHQINNELTKIYLLAEVLSRQGVPDSSQTTIQKIKESVTNVAESGREISNWAQNLER